MVYLNKKYFESRGDLDHELGNKLVTASFNLPVTQTLLNLGWTGNHVAMVGLELSPDNRHVRRGRYLLHGPLTKEPVNIQARKLFPTADTDIMMTITMPDAAEFRFHNGTLGSDLLPCEGYKHHFSRESGVIFPTDWPANNVGETCMRAISHLDKASNSALGPRPKTTVLLFPKSVDEMSQTSDGTQNVAWPGIRILQTLGEFFPKFAAWKNPICPLLLRGSSRDEAPNFPSGDELRFHIAEVMRSARLPTACNSQSGLAKQWGKAVDNVEDLEKEPAIIWPTVLRPTAPEGIVFFLRQYLGS